MRNLWLAFHAIASALQSDATAYYMRMIGLSFRSSSSTRQRVYCIMCFNGRSYFCQCSLFSASKVVRADKGLNHVHVVKQPRACAHGMVPKLAHFRLEFRQEFLNISNHIIISTSLFFAISLNRGSQPRFRTFLINTIHCIHSRKASARLNSHQDARWCSSG